MYMNIFMFTYLNILMIEIGVEFIFSKKNDDGTWKREIIITLHEIKLNMWLIAPR